MEPALERAVGLALSTLSDAERPTTAVYLDTLELRGGRGVKIGRAEMAIPATGFLAFVDPSPTANWGHPCHYLLVESGTGTIHRFPSQFPPFLRGASPTLRLIWKGRDVPTAVLPVTEGVE